MTVVRVETQSALEVALHALEEARHLLRVDGEWWASRDVEQALGLVRQAILDVVPDGRP